MVEYKKEVEDGVKKYFNDLKHIKPLSKEQEHILLKRYQQENDLKARNQLIQANLKYAAKIASQYRGNGISYWELISEANNGLMKSIDSFDLDYDVKFLSYARWWIIKSINDVIVEKQKLGENKLPTYGNNDDEIEDNYETNENFLVDGEVETLDEHDFDVFFNGLSEKEIAIIKMHFGLGYEKSLNHIEISKHFGITSERIRQIIGEVMKKMKANALIYIN